MYQELYSLMSEGLFEGTMTALQTNTVEVLATAGTVLFGLLPLLIAFKLILSFTDF